MRYCHETLDNVEVGGSPHICEMPYYHAGPHRCGNENHEVPSPNCPDDCCWDACDVTWPSTPEQMRAGEWTPDNAAPGDLIADPAWPLDRAIEITIVAKRHLIAEDASGREIVFAKGAFDWQYVLPQAKAAAARKKARK